MKYKIIKSLHLTLVIIGITGLSFVFTGCQSTNTSNNASTEISEDSENNDSKEETVAEKSAKLIDATQYSLDAPFTEATWASTKDDLGALEGVATNTYDSIYGGTTYVYESSLEGRAGSIKYMFDDKNALMCVAFTYLPETSDEVMDLYNTLHESLVAKLGESEYQAEHDTNYGDVWYREEGDIVISCMVTSEQNSLQFSYLNPIVSKYQMEAAAAK